MDIELRIATSINEHKVDSLVAMINQVYQESEGNIWVDSHHRVSKERLIEVIKANELLLAISEKEILGCIHLEKMNDTLYKFKMLMANPTFKGKGVGSLLVNYAEEQAKSYGAATMQLELLVPTEFIHPDKVFLDSWYKRIGYHQVQEYEVDYVHQGISKFLKVGCVAKIYQKTLLNK